MINLSQFKKVGSAFGLVGILSFSALAENGCPITSDSGTEIKLTFSNGGLDNIVRFGYNGDTYSNFIKSSLESKSAEASFPLSPNSYLYQLVSAPSSCDGDNCGTVVAPTEIRRYRIGQDLAIVRYYQGEIPVTTVISFDGDKATVTCFGANTTTPVETDALFSSLDLSSANEQFASSSSNTCSESEICPSIFPYSFIFATSDKGENFRGVNRNSRAQFYANRGLRTSGLNRRKGILKLALKELEAFVVTSSYRAGSISFRKSINNSMNLARRAVSSKSGPRQVRAALLAIRGR